jgi:hypothetical protein
VSKKNTVGNSGSVTVMVTVREAPHVAKKKKGTAKSASLCLLLVREGANQAGARTSGHFVNHVLHKGRALLR